MATLLRCYYRLLPYKWYVLSTLSGHILNPRGRIVSMTDQELYGEICWDTLHAAGLLESRYRWGKGHVVILPPDGLVRSPADVICWWHRSQYATTDRGIAREGSKGYTRYRKQWKVQLWHDRHRYYGGLYSYELQAIKAAKYLRDQLAMGNLTISTQDVYAYIEETKRK